MEHGSSTTPAAEAAYAARERREQDTGRMEFGSPPPCATCTTQITSFDDHGWTYHLCPVCDRTMLGNLQRERDWMIAEEKRARGSR